MGEDRTVTTTDYFEAVQLAVEELWLRGVDETTRKVRSRVLVELRCRRRGHLQARIYPTSWGPLLVSIEDNGLARTQSTDRMLHKGGFGRRRNPYWVLPVDWYNVGETAIPGGADFALLLRWPDLAAEVRGWDEKPSRLLCRCGSTALPGLDAMRETAEAATRENKTRKMFTG